MKMINLSILLIYLMVTSCVSTKVNFDDAESSLIFELLITDDLDSMIGSGGFELIMEGNNYYNTDLQNCGHEILKIGEKWARTNKLSIIKKLDNEEKSLLHIMSRDKSGYFEILYRFKCDIESHSFAKLELKYINATGQHLITDIISEIETETLRQNLLEATTCQRL